MRLSGGIPRRRWKCLIWIIVRKYKFGRKQKNNYRVRRDPVTIALGDKAGLRLWLAGWCAHVDLRMGAA